MKCNVCGTENENGSAFCHTCGNELIKTEYQVNNQNNPKKDDDKVVASIVLGAISLGLLLFGLGIIGIVTAIIGLILAITSSKDEKNKSKESVKVLIKFA